MKRENRGFIKDGLRVLITAGAAGIGRAIAEIFADNGAKVFTCDVDDNALKALEKDRPDIGAIKIDTADEKQIDVFFAKAKQYLGGGLDVLINNVGVAGPTCSVEAMSSDDWRRTIDINLNSHFYCIKRAVPMLKETTEGAIISLSSVAGRLGFSYRLPYSASKWGIVGMTKSLAIELGPFGIRVNALLPGVVEGKRIEHVISNRARQIGINYDDAEKELLEQVSLRRMVTGQDIAEMALFLCSPMGKNISGQALSVCGNVEKL